MVVLEYFYTFAAIIYLRPTLMTQLFIPRYKKVGGVNLFKALRAIPLLLLLVCVVSSCSKDEELFPVSIDQLYAESQTLQYQTPDSIEAFTQKFYGYLEYNPDAYNHPYYTAIDDKIYKYTHSAEMTVETDWDGETHVKY